MRLSHNFTHGVLTVDAEPGAFLPDCKKEAAIIALSEGVVVCFTHNGKEYRVDPKALDSFVELTGPPQRGDKPPPF